MGSEPIISSITETNKSNTQLNHATRYTGGMTQPHKGLLLAVPKSTAFTSFKLHASVT